MEKFKSLLRYELAIETLQQMQKPFLYDEKQGCVIDGKGSIVVDLGVSHLVGQEFPETRQADIGEMLAEFINVIVEYPVNLNG